MALCVHQLTTAWDVGGGSVTVYVYVWSYILSSLWTLQYTYTVKKRLATFPSLAGMSLTKLFLGGKSLIIPAQGECGKCMTSRLGSGYGNVHNLSLQWKAPTHENVKCTDDLSYVFLKLSLVAETRAEPLSRIASLLLHSWHRGHFSSPLIFSYLLKVMSHEKWGSEGLNRIGISHTTEEIV